MTDLVAVRMQPEFLSQVRVVATAQGFLSVQEYVREVVRRDLYQHYKRELDAIIASAKGKKTKELTRAERDDLARRFMREKEQYEKETAHVAKPADAFARYQKFDEWRKSKGLRD